MKNGDLIISPEGEEKGINSPLSHHKMDFFSVNTLIILIVFILLTVQYLLLHTSLGRYIFTEILHNPKLPMIILLLPFISAPLSAYLGMKSEDYRDIIMVNMTFITLLLVLFLYSDVMKETLLIQMPKILGFGLNFRIDFLVWMLLLAASVLWLLASIYAHNYMFEEEQHRSRFYFWMSITFGGVIGALMAEDLLTMFLFFEVMYLSCYFLVAHNQSNSALRAGNRYIYLGVTGGLSILFSMSLLYYHTGTFKIAEMGEGVSTLWQANQTAALAVMAFMLLGIGVKAAIFPLHFWLPEAHSSAPTPSSAILSGIVLKVYLFSLMKILIRILGPQVMNESGLPWLLTLLATISMIMGSILAIGQKDIKKMLAYSSVAQVGYILLGIGLANQMGYQAALFHMITHALMKGALFFCAGAIIYQKGKRNVKEFQGIGYEMPITMGVFSVAAFSMIGIPGLNGFMSKWYLSMAALSAGKPIFVIMIMISSFLNAIYYLPIIITAFLKENNSRKNVLTIDQVPKTMLAPMVLLATGCVVLGFFPQWLMGFIERAITLF